MQFYMQFLLSLKIFFGHNLQGMSCEGACAHAHVQSAVARVLVRAKSILESVWDVRAGGPFFDVRCATALLHTFWDKIARKCNFLPQKLF